MLWLDCKPNPVSSRSIHSFKVESAHTNTVREDLTSATVTVVAGVSAGIQLCTPGGAMAPTVSYGRIGPIGPGGITRPVGTPVQKQAGTYSQAEDVEVSVTFQAISLPGRPLPAGTGATILACAMTITIT